MNALVFAIFHIGIAILCFIIFAQSFGDTVNTTLSAITAMINMAIAGHLISDFTQKYLWENKK